MRSPGLTVLPGRTSLVMTREFAVGPASRGAAIVVDWTASTVPFSRTLCRKSRRATVNVVWRPPLSAWPSSAGWRPYKKTAAPARTTVVSTATRRAGVDLGFTRPPVIRRTCGSEGWPFFARTAAKGRLYRIGGPRGELDRAWLRVDPGGAIGPPQQ